MSPAGHPPVRVLVICTHNRCRSPLAAAMLRASLLEHDVPADVIAAGLRSPGRAATTQVATVGARRGLDLAAHRSRTLDPGLVDATDLILGMERAHVREVVALAPAAWPRAFTLKELVRRGEAVGSREPDESIADWLRRVGEGRTARDLLGESADDDVADPTGGPLAEHEDLAQELEDLVHRLAELVAVPMELPPVRWQSS